MSITNLTFERQLKLAFIVDTLLCILYHILSLNTLESMIDNVTFLPLFSVLYHVFLFVFLNLGRRIWTTETTSIFPTEKSMFSMGVVSVVHSRRPNK